MPLYGVDMVRGLDMMRFDCSICNDKFSENDVGLQRGFIGNTLISLCPMCFKGMMNLADYINNRTPIEE